VATRLIPYFSVFRFFGFSVFWFFGIPVFRFPSPEITG